MEERLIETNGAEICTESFGDPADPPILLIMGLGASMLWWEEDFCRILADGGRFIIRYDHRDTGRSTTYELGNPGYTNLDLVDDAAAVLDAYDIPSAHIVGVSAGGALAQFLALDHPARVRSLTLISTSRALPGARDLPPPTEAFGRFFATAKVDRSDTASVVDYLTGYDLMLTGTERPPDETAIRDLVRSRPPQGSRSRPKARRLAHRRPHNPHPHDRRAPPKPVTRTFWCPTCRANSAAVHPALWRRAHAPLPLSGRPRSRRDRTSPRPRC